LAAVDDETRFPLWVYGVVGLALVLFVLWIVRAVLGAIAGLVQMAILVVLAMAVIGWAVNAKNERS
jgi:hypothetical protein